MAVRPRLEWKALALLLATTGVLHFVRPKPFDRLIPRALGQPRRWVLGSGAAELVVAASLLHPQSRRLGGWAAAGLFVGIFPGNLTMAVRVNRSKRTSTLAKALTIARLPLQVPLVWWATKVARRG